MATPSSASPDPSPTDLRADHLGALLLAVGMASLLDIVTAIGRAAVAAWAPSPLLPLVFFLVTLLAFYRHRWIRLYRPYGNRLPIYLAELMVLLLLTRLLPLLATPGRLLALLPVWWAEPLAFFDLPFLVDAGLVGAAWYVGHSLGAAVDQLHLQPGELPPPRGTPEYASWERSQAAFDHRGAQRRIAGHVLGGALIAILGLAVLGVAPSAGGLLIEGAIAAGLALLCALLLLAWSHVTLLDTLWRLDGLAVPGGLMRRWPGWLALLLVGVALVALVAPRSYALDPLVLIVWLLQVVVVIVQVLLFLIALPFIWLASLFGWGGGAGAPAARPPMLPPSAESSGSEFPFLATLRSLGFWLVTLALAIYSVRTLYQSRWGAMRLLPRLAVWERLVGLWRGLLAGLRSRVATLAAALRPGSAARDALNAALRRPQRLPRPTDPRGLVQFLYLSLIERAGRRGYPRRRGMTAAEYSRYLAGRLAALDPPAGANATDPAAARAELDVLTAAFLEARYSRHAVGEAEASRARRALQRLLAFIRRPAAPR